jgi:hypothetical protein
MKRGQKTFGIDRIFDSKLGLLLRALTCHPVVFAVSIRIAVTGGGETVKTICTKYVPEYDVDVL